MAGTWLAQGTMEIATPSVYGLSLILSSIYLFHCRVSPLDVNTAACSSWVSYLRALYSIGPK